MRFAKREICTVVNEIVNMDSTEASVVKKYQEVRYSPATLVFGDTANIKIERLDAGRELRLTKAKMLTNSAKFGR
jgi:hypothetical protein